MKFKSIFSSATRAAVALSLSGLVSEASADTLIFSGVVTWDVEYNALGVRGGRDFPTGSVDNTFLGQTVSEAFTYDRTRLGADTAFGYTVTGAGGGIMNGYFGPSSPVSAVSLTVGGHTIFVDTRWAYDSYVENVYSKEFGYGQESAEAWIQEPAGPQGIFYTARASISGGNVSQYGNGIGSRVGTGQGSFSWGLYQDCHYGCWAAQSVAGVEFSVTSVSFTVPETSTWVMMLAGFAVVGFAGYRHNKAATSAA